MRHGGPPNPAPLRDAWIADTPPRCSWKRSTDPETGAPKRFGFAEFASPDGVLRALRVLREYPLAGSELLLNVSQATQKFLDFHVAQTKSRGRATIVAAPQLSNPPADGAAPVPSSVAAEAAAEAAEEAAADKAAISAIQVRLRCCARLRSPHSPRLCCLLRSWWLRNSAPRKRLR